MVSYCTTKEAGIYNVKKAVSTISDYWKRCTATLKRIKVEHHIIPYTKINSKWIKTLNVRYKAVKLEENICSRLFDITVSNIFWFLFPQPRETKNKQMRPD